MRWDDVCPAESITACNASLRGDNRPLAQLIERGLIERRRDR